jgi:BASS family bile acid:Na+ symporter
MSGVLAWLQKRMVWLLLGSYAAGALVPSLGVAMRDVSMTARLPGIGTILETLPMLMLGFLLVVAGLGVNLRELRQGLRIRLLLVGLAVNTSYPIAFAALAAIPLLSWHSTGEAQSILVGLAMIGAMPIAGASTAWAQNAEGNVALSLGLVLASTVLSPVLTPLGLDAIGQLTHGDYSEDLHELARGGSRAFVVLAVVIPSVLGLALRAALGDRCVLHALPVLKAMNLVVLLVLSYSNAALALPKLIARPDWDFIVLTFAITATMCAGAFAAGWGIARSLRAVRADRIALTYGVGMSNNGAGLVLAASALSDHPLVLPPIILYNLVQQIVAGAVDALRRREAPQIDDER